jgi:hypothetical protein
MEELTRLAFLDSVELAEVIGYTELVCRKMAEAGHKDLPKAQKALELIREFRSLVEYKA